MSQILPDSFKFVAFLRFCKWREKVSKMGKCSKMRIFSPKGENIHLWENVPLSGKVFTFREIFPVISRTGKIFPYKHFEGNIFPQNSPGEYFPSKISGGIFSPNSQVNTLGEPHKWILLSADTGSVSNSFPQEAEGPG